MSDHTPSFPRDEIRVIHRSRFRDYFISQGGHTFPATPAVIAHRFGEIFLRAITAEPDCWIYYDATDMERIAQNRQRYEAVGQFMPSPDRICNWYAVYDHARGEMVGAMPSVGIDCGILCPSYQDALEFIDGLGMTFLLPAELEVFTKAGRRKSTEQQIAKHHAAAVDAVTAILSLPTHPAA